jgi:hypothetical protein
MFQSPDLCQSSSGFADPRGTKLNLAHRGSRREPERLAQGKRSAAVGMRPPNL